MTRLIGIYAIKNTVTNKYYIGSSIDIARRFSQHKSKLKYNRHGSPKLQAAWNKYGESAFIFEILQFPLKKVELLEYEIKTCEQYDSIQNGYNCFVPGDSRKRTTYPRHKHTQETKDKIAAAHLGKSKPPLSEEHKEKLRQANLTRVITPEQALEISAKISSATKGKRGIPWSDETRQKILAKRVGSKRSEETKQRMREAAKKAWELRKTK